MYFWEIGSFVKVPSSTIFSLADKDLEAWEARFDVLDLGKQKKT